jgi:hypothetical protein
MSEPLKHDEPLFLLYVKDTHTNTHTHTHTQVCPAFILPCTVAPSQALARNALNRSELARIDMDKELRNIKAELVTSTARVVAHQDQARCVSCEVVRMCETFVLLSKEAL